ncbi:MAG: stage III sporulation protein AE [Clostridiales bacterium]|nr:stage III sporulation protein AE [Clostridiales bacterium]
MIALKETLVTRIRRGAKKIKQRRRYFLLSLFLIVIAALFLPFGAKGRGWASAESSEEAAALEQLGVTVEELLASLDTAELEAYLNSLADFKDVSLKEKLLSLITGDYTLDYSSLGESILHFVWQEAETMLPAFAVILAVSLLCGVLNLLKNGFLHSTMSDIINFVGYIAVGAVTFACLVDVLKGGFSAVTNMKKQMDLVYPILLTLMAASGGGVSAAMYRPAVAFMSGAITNLFSTVVMPIAVVVIVLSFLGNLNEDVRTDKLGEFFKSASKWVVGLALGIFSIFLSVQGITAAQYDGISLRAAKYVISGSVPIVGGFLSGGVEIVIAGSALIKNALGSFALFLLFGVLLRPVLLFTALQLFLRLSAAATEPAGGKISSFLSKMAGDTGYFLAAILSVGFLYFLTLLLMLFSTGVMY